MLAVDWGLTWEDVYSASYSALSKHLTVLTVSNDTTNLSLPDSKTDLRIITPQQGKLDVLITDGNIKAVVVDCPLQKASWSSEKRQQ